MKNASEVDNQLLDAIDATLAAAFERRAGPARPIARVAAAIDGDTVIAERRPDSSILDDDVLGRSPDALAMAELICLSDAPLPLAFGLFGNWGSGKSTFMAMIRAGIDRTAEMSDSVKDSKERAAFVSNIVHINFNAWHYTEVNLWASIGTHLFQELERQCNQREKRDWLKDYQLEGLIRRLDTLREVEDEADEAVARTDEKRQEIEKRLECVNTKIEKRNREARDKRARFFEKSLGKVLHEEFKSGLRGLGYDREIADLAPIDDLVMESRQVAGRLRLFRDSLAATPSKTLLWLLLGLVVYVLFLAGVEWTGVLTSGAHPLAQIIRGAFAQVKEVLASAAAIATSTIAALQSFNKRLEPVYKAYKSLIGEQNGEAKSAMEEVAKLEGELELLRAQRDSYLSARESALRERVELEAMKKGERPSRILSHYIAKRAEAQDYRKHLGLVSLLRQDFGRMSELMAEQRRLRDEGEQNRVAKDLPQIDRIVLYIDDLDRCPHATVVKVLEAVNLLLAFPLFVVIVGVDPRWLQVSLSKHYQDQLGFEKGEVSVWDYLEKIFQIPYHLLPLNTGGGLDNNYARLVARIVGTTVQRSPELENGEISGSSDGRIRNNGGKAPSLHGTEERVIRQLKPITVFRKTPTRKSTSAQVLERVTLTEPELVCLQGIGPLAGTSPRTAKRVINLYRVVRTRWPVEEMDDFLGRSSADRAMFPAAIYYLAADAGLDAVEYRRFIQLITVTSSLEMFTGNGMLFSSVLDGLRSREFAQSEAGVEIPTEDELLQNKLAAFSAYREAISRNTKSIGSPISSSDLVSEIGSIANRLVRPTADFEHIVKSAIGAVPPLIAHLSIIKSHPLIAPYGFREPTDLKYSFDKQTTI